jgi:glutathionylspermidine synthase
LQKQLTKAVQKKSTIVNWNKVYEELRTRFLLEFSGDPEARTFIDNLKSDFINKGKKLKASDYSNITGFIGENLEAVIQSNNTISLAVYDAGERNDTELVEYANDIAKKMGFAKNQLSISSNQVGSAKQSGSDWIITNK